MVGRPSDGAWRRNSTGTAFNVDLPARSDHWWGPHLRRIFCSAESGCSDCFCRFCSLRVRRALGSLMVLVASIQMLDVIMDCIEGRWAIVPGVPCSALLRISFGSCALSSGAPFWSRDILEFRFGRETTRAHVRVRWLESLPAPCSGTPDALAPALNRRRCRRRPARIPCRPW